MYTRLPFYLSKYAAVPRDVLLSNKSTLTLRLGSISVLCEFLQLLNVYKLMT